MLRFGTEAGSAASGCAPTAVDCETTLVTAWCTHEGEECYVETTVCPRPDAPPSDCTTTSEGDPMLKQDPWEHFAGLSENYAVIYLAEPAPAHGWTALMLGAGDDGLAAGYHLLELAPGDDAREEEASHCRDQAGDLAAERYNDAHDTAFASYNLEADDCGLNPMPCNDDGSVCGPTYLPCPEDAVEEWHRLREQIQAELDCTLTGELVITPVADPASEPVSVRIGPDLRPLGR